MGPSTLRASWAAVSAAVLLTAISPAWAAGRPGGRVRDLFHGPGGWSAPVPAGWEASWQPQASRCGAGTPMLGSLVYLQDDAEVLRLDLYCDATQRSPRKWLTDELAAVVLGATTADGLATTARTPAVIAELAKTPQRHAQRAIFFRLNAQMAQLTCQLGAGPQIAAACAAVQDGVSPAAAPASGGGRSKP